MTRTELAELIADATNGRVWAPKDEEGVVRVYMGKRGFCQIETDGVNIDAVGRTEVEGVKAACAVLGVTSYRR